MQERNIVDFKKALLVDNTFLKNEPQSVPP